MNNNGVISFKRTFREYSPRSFPLTGGEQLIAPFWADVDTRGTGTVWYRETTDVLILNRVSEDIRKLCPDQFDFQPMFVFMVTWDRVGYFSSKVDLVSVILT